MKIGLLAYSTDTGLGNQTFEFYYHMHPEKTLLIDLSQHNQMKTNHAKYPTAKVNMGYPTNDSIKWLVEGVDVIFVCETPLNYFLFEYAKSQGVLTIQQPNPEFLDYFRQPHLPKPDVLALPTPWMRDKIEALNLSSKIIQLPVPVNRELIPFREINRLETFIHIIGRPAVHDRNGTIAFLEAAKKLGDGYKYKIYMQVPTDKKAIEYHKPVAEAIEEAKKVVEIEVITDVPNYQNIYEEGDCLVLPRKYGGLCLPMQEALAAGMPVIMPSTSPNNDLLPSDWLVEANQVGSFFAHTDVDIYEINVDNLVDKMKSVALYMSVNNQIANSKAEEISWGSLKPIYTQVFSALLKS